MQKTPHSKIQLYGHTALKRIIMCTEPVTDKGGHTGHVTIALTNVRWLSERFAHVTRWVGDTTVAKMAPLQLPASIQHSPHTCPQ